MSKKLRSGPAASHSPDQKFAGFFVRKFRNRDVEKIDKLLAGQNASIAHHMDCVLKMSKHHSVILGLVLDHTAKPSIAEEIANKVRPNKPCPASHQDIGKRSHVRVSPLQSL
jgi:hypothetical protein